MFTALASLLTERRVRPDVAMTGEITLRGNVLPVGGVKEKILAAHRAGIKRVILPKRNEKDLVEVPDEIRKDVEIAFVQRMDELLPLALEDTAPDKTEEGGAGTGGTRRRRSEPPKVTPEASA
jgi:ATP-dependent Lon protease